MLIKGFNVTEKSVGQSQEGKYTLWVDTKANKNQIKSEVEQRFEVDVEKVNTINLKGKTKGLQQQGTGKRKDRKKAIVTLKEGQKINEFEVNE